jgi:hypothetical protein
MLDAHVVISMRAHALNLEDCNRDKLEHIHESPALSTYETAAFTYHWYSISNST